MKRRIVRFLLTALVIAASGTPSNVTASLIPVDLSPGDQFHLAFLTRDNENGQRTLDFYNQFVGEQAVLAGSLTESTNTTWRAIASTAFVDARDNVSVGDHVPIYLLDGTLVATGALDLWDGAIINPISLNQFGEVVTDTVYTGSRSDGIGFAGRELEICIDFGCNVRVGFSTSIDSTWISFNDLVTGNRMKLYAVSGVLTVPVTIPEPSTLALFAAGLAGLGFMMRRRRRSMQLKAA